MISKADISEHPEHFLRRAGYAFIRDSRRGEESYVRRLGSYFYPRLHMYVEESGDKILFNLHLDQKQASYEGSRMHNGEHDGEVVQSEIERLKNIITHNANSHNAQCITRNEKAPYSSPLLNKERGQDGESVDKIGGERDYTKDQPKKEKKSWWKRLFS